MVTKTIFNRADIIEQKTKGWPFCFVDCVCTGRKRSLLATNGRFMRIVATSVACTAEAPH